MLYSVELRSRRLQERYHIPSWFRSAKLLLFSVSCKYFQIFFSFRTFFSAFSDFPKAAERVFGRTHTNIRNNSYGRSKEGIRTFDCYHTNFWLLPYELSTATIRSRLAVSKATTKSLWRHNIDCLEPRTRAFGTATHYNRHPTTRHCVASDTKTPII